MSTATDRITELQDQVLDLVSRVQEPLVEGIKNMAEKVEGRLPEINVPWVGDQLPTASEFVDSGFGFAQKALDNGRQFASSVLDATEPVREKFVTAAPATKSGAKKKAA